MVEKVPFRSGSCLCRGVTFRVFGDPLRVGICHCTDCRKASGSTFSAFAIWPAGSFEQLGGYVNSYGGRSFCTTCGGRVMSIRADEVEVMIGSLDQAPTELQPEYELWIGRRERWLNALPATMQFDKDREGSDGDTLAATSSESEPEADGSGPAERRTPA